MKFEFIRTEKAHYPVTVLCAVLEVSRSGFHAWLKRPPSARATSDAQLAVQVAASHQRSRRRYLKLERNEAAWKALDPALAADSLAAIPWSEWEFVEGGYDPP